MLEQQAYTNALSWVAEAAQIIKELMKNGLTVQTKLNHSDLVTVVDREVERFFVEKIKTHYPDHMIMGEENIGNTSSEGEYIWIIDPIDGTTNMVNRQQDFAISVAFCSTSAGVFGIVYDVAGERLFRSFKGEGAYLNDMQLQPLSQETRLENELLAITLPWSQADKIDQWGPYLKLVAKSRGIRVFGATTIELCDIAMGKLGAYVQYRVNAWDYAASRVILEELGCKFSDLEGKEIAWTHHGGVMASTSAVHAQMVAILK